MALVMSDKRGASMDGFISELADVVTAQEIARFGTAMDKLKFERPHPRLPRHLSAGANRADDAMLIWLAFIGRKAVSAIVEHSIAAHVAKCLEDTDAQIRDPYALQETLMQSAGCAEVVARHWSRGLQRFLSQTQGQLPDDARAEFEALLLALRPADTYDDSLSGDILEEKLNQLSPRGTDAPDPPLGSWPPTSYRAVRRCATSVPGSARTRTRRLARSHRTAGSLRPTRWETAPLTDAGDGSCDVILTISESLMQQAHWRAGDVLHVVARAGTLRVWKAPKPRPLKSGTKRTGVAQAGRHTTRPRAER